MFSAILLAAGQSSRMGRLKALLPWGETTLMEAQIEQIACSEASELVIVTGYRHDLLDPQLLEMKDRFKHELNIKLIHNLHYRSGKTSSIRLAMTCVSRHGKGVAILGVDQPVTSWTLDRLFMGLEEKAIRIPLFEGRKGHPPVFSSHYYGELGHVSEHNQGLREVTRKHNDCVQLIEVSQPQVLLNLNREQDYISAKEQGLDLYPNTDEYERNNAHVYS